MKTRPVVLVLVAGALLLIVSPLLSPLPRVDAQGVSNQVIVNYLTRMGVTWRASTTATDVWIVTKTTGLKRAEKVEIVITNLPKDDLVTLRAYPLIGGKYLAFAAAGDRPGLAKAMLEKNATAFGAYYIDEDGDVGFRYVFTTESGLGYEAFRVAVTELLRIADDPIVALYNRYR